MGNDHCRVWLHIDLESGRAAATDYTTSRSTNGTGKERGEDQYLLRIGKLS